MLEDILIPIAFFGTVTLIVYFTIQAQIKQNRNEHEERMLALEKGVDIPLTPEKKKEKNPYVWPFILIALGLAIAVRSILEGDFSLSWSLIPLLMGVGLLIAHYIFQRQKEKDEKKEDFPSNPVA